MSQAQDRHAVPATKGRLIHGAAGYDLLVWMFLLGRERKFRERLIELAGLERGQSVLDVGCGTGSLAIAAKRHVGDAGRVHGLDASPEMVARARKKARKAGLAIEFTHGVVEQLPFPDAQFDVVLSTLMLHHLPRAARASCLAEGRRVLKPGGRMMVVDFGRVPDQRKGLIEHIHRRHGHVAADQIAELFRQARFEITGTGRVGVRDLNYVIGKA